MESCEPPAPDAPRVAPRACLVPSGAPYAQLALALAIVVAVTSYLLFTLGKPALRLYPPLNVAARWLPPPGMFPELRLVHTCTVLPVVLVERTGVGRTLGHVRVELVKAAIAVLAGMVMSTARVMVMDARMLFILPRSLS